MRGRKPEWNPEWRDGDANQLRPMRGRPGSARGRKRTATPEWALDTSQLQAFLLRAFPNMVTDDTQRAKAGRWARVFHLYYVMKLPASAVAAELETSRDNIQRILRSMRNYAAGKTGKRPRGRPKKKFNWVGTHKDGNMNDTFNTRSGVSPPEGSNE